MVIDDPDDPSGLFIHWVMWNINPDDNVLPAHLSPEVYNQGLNGRRQKGYIGSCPPSGQHRYFFRLYALGAKLVLPESTTKAELVEAMKGHILAEAVLMGTYQKAY